MGERTGVEWCHHTFNPWWGCARVSTGCLRCYAEKWSLRFDQHNWGAQGTRRVTSDKNWSQPLKWNRQAIEAGQQRLVFCASMADVFEDHPALPEPRERLWELINATPALRWLLLTKRPGNVPAMAPWGDTWPENVSLGTSVENQAAADERMPLLCSVPAELFVSAEPLLGPVDLSPWMTCDHQSATGIDTYEGPDKVFRCDWCSMRYRDVADPAGDITPPRGPAPATAQRREILSSPQLIKWVITGGETQAGSRPPQPAWFRSLRDQAADHQVPFFFKQWGDWTPDPSPLEKTTRPYDGTQAVGMWRVGKKAAGAMLDGREYREFPAAAGRRELVTV